MSYAQGTQFIQKLSRARLVRQKASASRIATPSGVASVDEAGNPRIAETLAMNTVPRALGGLALGGMGAAGLSALALRRAQELATSIPRLTPNETQALHQYLRGPAARRFLGKSALYGSGLGLAAGVLGGAARGAGAITDASLLNG